MIFIGVELEFGKFPKLWWWDLDNCAIRIKFEIVKFKFNLIGN